MQSPIKAILRLVKWVFTLVGLAMLSSALVSAYHTHTYLRQSITTQGQVIELREVHSYIHRNSVYFAPVFRFTSNDGHIHTVVSQTSSNPPELKAGDLVTIHYPKGKPEEAMIDSFVQLWLGDVIYGVLGALLAGLTLIVWIFGRWGPPRTVPSANGGQFNRQ